MALIQSHKDTSPWLLAIDGGGSKVAGVIGSLNSASAGTRCHRTNLSGTGSAAIGSWDRAQENISVVVQELLKQAGVEAESVNHAVFMLAGAGRPQDVTRIADSLKQHPQLSLLRKVTITSDVMPLLFHARQLQPTQTSIVAIVGTGSLVAALDAKDQITRAGGWGPVLGDQGSGWSIARAALMQLCDWIDQGEGSASIDALELYTALHQFMVDMHLLNPIRGLHQTNRDDLSSAILKLSADRHLAAKFAPRLIELASVNNNSQCAAILAQQITSLCAQIACVHHRLQLRSQPWQLCMAGGLVCHQSSYRESLFASLEAKGLTPETCVLLDPLEAALTFACRSSSNPADPQPGGIHV